MNTLAVQFGDSFFRNTIATLSFVGIGGAVAAAVVFNWLGWGIRNGFSVLCSIVCLWFIYAHFYRNGAWSGDTTWTAVTGQMQADMLWFIPVIAVLAILYRKRKAIGTAEAFLHGTLLTIIIVHLLIPLVSGVDMTSVKVPGF